MTASNARRERRANLQTKDKMTDLADSFSRQTQAQQQSNYKSASSDWDLYQKDWLAGRIADCLSEDMTREGIKIHGLDDDDQSKILRLMTKWRAWERITESKRCAYIFGGCALWIDIDGQKHDEPLNLKSIKPESVTLHSRDKRDFLPHGAMNRISKGPDFGLPEFWQDSLISISTNNAAGAMPKIHHSRVLRFNGIDLPLRELQNNNFWGISLFTRARPLIADYEEARKTPIELMKYAMVRGLKLPGLKAALQDKKSCEMLAESMVALNTVENYTRKTLVDAEGEIITQTQSFGGLIEPAREQLLAVAGCYGIPLTRLIGQAPAGMNATGESDEKIYKSTIKQRQENELRYNVTSIVNLAHWCLFNKPLPDDARIEFKPLETPSQKEVADTLKSTADAVAAYVSGAAMLWDEDDFIKQAGIAKADMMGELDEREQE